MTTTKEWRKLNDFQHARKRIEMYFGSRDPHTQTVLEYHEGKPIAVETTWIPSIFTAFREIVDNALDEMVTHGHGNRLEVTFDPKTMVFSVSDNGRGIPIDWDEDEQNYAASVLLTETKAGRNFDERGSSRGMNGIGASVVNYASEYFQIDVRRDRKHFSQRFVESADQLISEDPMIMPDDSKGSGTRVEFKLSPTVFKNMTLPESFVRARITEIALCYPGLKVFYNGKQIKTKGSVEKTLFGDEKPISFTVRENGFVSHFWCVPEFFDNGEKMAYGLVNAIPTFNGGAHIDAFERQFYAGLIQALEPKVKRHRIKLVRGDIEDGLLLFNITEMADASFDSQNKTRLINESAAKSVKSALDDPEFFKKIVKNYPEWVDKIVARALERTQKKDDAEASKIARKTLRQKVEDLHDASGMDRTKSVLFLAEGKSAVSGIVETRNAEIHGSLPLRGKILNVHGEATKTILQNAALSNIMKSIGLVPQQKAIRRQLRYGAVYITTDADEDGKNIAALLINFFYTLWPELFDPNEKPFVYLFDTPLIIAVKGKQRKFWFNDDYHTFDTEAHKGWEITRAKGLAALKRDDWKEILAKPKLVPIQDDGGLEAALSLLFDSKKADERKEWIGM